MVIDHFSVGVFIQTRKAVLSEEAQKKPMQVDMERSTLTDMMVLYHASNGN